MKQPRQELFVLVETFDVDGDQVGTRVVDMYHYGTKDWLTKHLWWATHQGHLVKVTSGAEIIRPDWTPSNSAPVVEVYSQLRA